MIYDVEEAKEEAKDIPGDVKAGSSILSSIEEALEEREGHEEGCHTEVEDTKTARRVGHSLVFLLQELRVECLKAGILRRRHLLLLHEWHLLLGLKVVVSWFLYVLRLGEHRRHHHRLSICPTVVCTRFLRIIHHVLVLHHVLLLQ